ncbi:hypothetical protein GCM10025857_24670 [Alicyclobacillus contaminans]|nr:hypothetical protein GCM10025857_24670 [Alicyclobacillus contaminans]
MQDVHPHLIHQILIRVNADLGERHVHVQMLVQPQWLTGQHDAPKLSVEAVRGRGEGGMLRFQGCELEQIVAQPG